MRSQSLNFFRRAVPVAMACWTLASSAEPAKGIEHQLNGRPIALQVAVEATHRAIFCGAPGTETSAYYSRALSGDLDQLRAAGMSARQAIDYINGRICGTERASRAAAAHAK